MANRIRQISWVVALVMVTAVTMTGCIGSDDAVSSDTTSTVASSQEANAESQPTQDPANVKPAPIGPQPTALPTQPVPLQGTDADGDGFYTATEMQAAITALFDYYEWPAGYTPDVESATSGYDEGELADDTFEAPGEYTVVGLQYKCAWGQTWLDAFAAGDTATMDESLRNLRAELELNPMIVPPTQQQYKAMYDKASMGDPALLLRHVELNCGGWEWLDQPATPG